MAPPKKSNVGILKGDQHIRQICQISGKLMSRQNFIERRSVIHRFARAGIKFEPALIRSFSAAFGCSPTSIYNDLRTLEPETGRLLINPPNLAFPAGGKRSNSSKPRLIGGSHSSG
jgi:hypothetical protein